MSARLRASLDSESPQGLDPSTALSALLALATALTLLLVPTAAMAVVVEVDTLTEFNDAVTNWQTGEEIEIQDGTYDDWGQVHVNVGGASGDPLVIRGESKSGVIFTGNTNFFIDASYVEFKTMTFSALESEDIEDSHVGGGGGIGPGGGDIAMVIWVYDCGDVLLTDLAFEDLRVKGIWISGGKNVQPMRDIRIEDSEFTSSGDPDCTVPECKADWANILIGSLWGDVELIKVSGNTFTEYFSTAVAVKATPNWVAHEDTVSILNNEFHNGSTESVVELGIDKPLAVLNATFAGNLIKGHSVENSGGGEMIEVKSHNNRILNNSFIDVGGHVSNRLGSNNVYDGNYFFNATNANGAIRIHDPDNQVTNNIFVGGKDGLRLKGVSGQEADRTLVANNTFIGQSRMAIRLWTIDPPPDRLPEDNIVINNVIVGEAAKLISHEMASSTIMARNLFHVTSGSVTQSDPKWGYEPFFEDPVVSGVPDEDDPNITFGDFVVGRGLSINELTQLAVSNDYLGNERPASRGTDLGHLEQDDDCPATGDATSTITPTTPTVNNLLSLQVVASSIEDPDGLGYPLLWTTNHFSLTQTWDFNASGTSGATPLHPLMAWVPNPTVTFDLGPITVPTTHPMELSVWDQTGCETTEIVNVTVNPVPTAPTNVWGGVAGYLTAVAWEGATSPNGIDHYIVFRDGVAVATPTGTLFFENPGGSGTYLYTIKAVDPYGAIGPASAPPLTLVIP